VGANRRPGYASCHNGCSRATLASGSLARMSLLTFCNQGSQYVQAAHKHHAGISLLVDGGSSICTALARPTLLIAV
jgi:hypothetical protein